ncbi:MAG TPA: hypothetical protein VF750_01405 [Sphingomicrobium sp.]
MEKRPTSLTVIAVIMIVLAAIGLIGVFVLPSTPQGQQALAQMNMSPAAYQALGAVGAIVTLVCAYGILKGQPWSRVLYVVWGVIGLVIGFYTSPMKAGIVLNLVVLVVIAAFLWTNNANDWFQARGFMLKRERSR